MSTFQQLSNAIRVLSMDAVQKANSGHPGMPMGMADIATVLWKEFLQHNPANPHWVNRDRFILSNGHGAMLQYALLHLTGYDVTIEDLQNFRQLHSRTPGHPEYGYTAGVESTTGPLGQGIGHAVGMALAEKILSATFNRPGYPIVDHYTYVFLGDGCLMEGISHEISSLAGTLGLGKLIAFWDNNGISIDGPVSTWFTDDTPKRFEAYQWHVVPNINGHDPAAIRKAIQEARYVKDKPSLIACKTTIAFGAPHLAGTSQSHGGPLGEAEVEATRAALSWTDKPFFISDDIYEMWNARAEGEKKESDWNQQWKNYQSVYPELAAELLRRLKKALPQDWKEKSQHYITNVKADAIATRKASQLTLNQYALSLSELIGGSADLTESNGTLFSSARVVTSKNAAGNYIHYGVREFGMSAIMTGIALHGGFIPYGGTFLVFCDYARNAIRLAALMKQRVIFVYTHDSIGLGEDGPTHQPIEHLSMLRMTPNLSVWRPCDATETAIAWQQAIERTTGPTCLIFSRQALSHQTRSQEVITNISRGAYTLIDCENTPQIIIIATGSEVSLAVAAAKQLNQEGLHIRVVSMLSVDRFIAQDKAYQEHVLPSSIKARLAIEAAAEDYWYRFVGLEGRIIGMNRYGESAPASDVFKAFGFTVEHVISTVRDML